MAGISRIGSGESKKGCRDPASRTTDYLRMLEETVQRLADEIGLPIKVCHLPPGTSKWNKIEHRLFSFISLNWCGRPLVSHEVIVNLIANTTTRSGLKGHAELDTHRYPKRVVVSDAEFAALHIEREAFHGEWNYRITPRHTGQVIS